MIKQNTIKPLVFFSLGLVITCLHFWISSRYPGLSAKATLGPDAPMSSLGFSPIFTITEDMGFWARVFFETLNWANTNRKGMTFAFIVGAFILSILPLFKKTGTGHSFFDSFLGLIVGTPLGVCANCAAPIAQSALSSGASKQFSLSLLIASPTMNFVVLFTAFTLFPFYLVSLKIGLTLMVILILVPLGARYIFANDSVSENVAVSTKKTILTDNNKNIPTDLIGSLIWSAGTYIKNLWYLIKIALPLMILAGFLGNLLSVSLPWATISSFTGETSLLFFLPMLFLIAAFGAFLPSPIAFDVVISFTLLQMGIPIYFVAPLLLTIGSFSIYAFFILWQSISLRAAFYMYFCMVLIGVTAGVITFYVDRYDQANKSLQIQTLGHMDNPFAGGVQEINVNHRLYQDIATDIQPITKGEISNPDIPENLEIYATAHKQKPNGEAFVFKSGAELNIDIQHQVTAMSYLMEALPNATTGISSADVHNDGWPDVLLSGDADIGQGYALYTNINGARFERQRLPVVGDKEAAIITAMFDINGDHWPDIFISTTQGNNYIFYNDRGDFKQESVYQLPETKGVTVSLSVGDVEGDGDLDLFFGNWSAGPAFINNPQSRNFVLFQNDDHSFDYFELPGVTGETLTSLFSDFNNDGILDLYVGNDYIEARSDQLFQGFADGRFEIFDYKNFDGLSGASTTMSIDSGDIDNDLTEDYYIGQIAYIGRFEQEISRIAAGQITRSNYCALKARRDGLSNDECTQSNILKDALSSATHYNPDACNNVDDAHDKAVCLIHYQTLRDGCGRKRLENTTAETTNIIGQNYIDFCNAQYASFDAMISQKNDDKKSNTLLMADNQSLSNVLLRGHDNNGKNISFENITKNSNTGYGAWTWNARIADLDNDGWKDIYIVNGYPALRTYSTNVFYKNLGHRQFENETDKFNLKSYSPTSAFTLLDYNNDGNLDIIALPTDSAVEIFEGSGQNNAIQFSLRDNTGKNTQGIGARLVITYDEDGITKKQMHIIKNSGGYRSFNQPIAHFGLKNSERIQSLEIIWRDGEKQTLPFAFNANKHYTITRI